MSLRFPVNGPTPRADSMATLRRDAWRDLASCLVVLAVVAGSVGIVAELGVAFALRSLLVFVVAAACMLRWLPAHAPNACFGAANRVTLARLALISLLAAGIGEPLADDASTLTWSALGIATLAALLDAVDGPLARARGLASAFGARFDMETDALLILVLCLLVVHLDKAGIWVLASGLMRYAFVLAMRGWTWLARPLPPSQRRKTVCVVQISALIVCLAPIVSAPWSQVIAGLSLVALAASFAIDIAWLARDRTGLAATTAVTAATSEPAP